MKKLYSPFALRTAFVVLFMLSFVRGWGQTLIYKLDLAAQASAFGTSNSYANKSGTVNGVTWYVNAGSCQSASDVWLGTNNAGNRTSLAVLSSGVNGRGGAIANALGITTSTVGYYAIVSANTINNVGSIKVKADATGGTAPTTLWCLYTTDGGATYNILDSKASPGTTEQTFTPSSTISSAQYAFVYYSAAFGTYRKPYFEFYEPSCTDPGLAFGVTSVVKSVGDPTFTETATSSSAGVITYSSSNPTSASVNSTTGQITVGSAGTATITASQVANGTHCADTATYSITVNSTDPTINTSGNLSSVNTTYGTASSTPTSFTASASNLTGNLIITPPVGFEISTSNTFVTSFNNASPLSITPTAGVVPLTSIYVRLAATTPAATYSGDIALTSTGAATVNVATVSSTVSQKALTITGLTAAATKVYDQNTSVSVTGTPSYFGLANGETFPTVLGTVTWDYPDANVGTGKILTRTGSYIAPSTNYTVTQPSLTANITAKPLTISGATAQDKSYDGTDAAVITGTLTGVISPDAATLSGTGTFASPNVGTGIAVTSTSTLTGAASGNYSLTQPTGLTANITAVAPTITTSTINIAIPTPGSYTLAGPNVTSNSAGAFSYSLGTATPSGSVTLTGGNILNGIAAGTATLTVNQAANGNYTAGSTTVTVNVVTVVYTANDYRTIGGGTWSTQNTGTATWQKWNTVTNQWETSTKPTATASNVYIRHTISSNGASTVASVIVEGPNVSEATPGGNYTLGTASTINSKLLVQKGGLIEITAALTNNGILEVENEGILNINYATASGTATIWNGTENFHPGSLVNIKNWNYGASAAIKSLIQNPSIISQNESGFYFGNLTISGNLTSTFPMVAGNQTINLCSDNFTRTAIGSNIFFTTSSADITIGGDIIVTAGQVSFAAANSGTQIININGNLIGNGGNINLNQNNSTSVLTLNLLGNLFIKNTNTLSSANENSIFNFKGIGNGLTSETTQTIDVGNQATAGNIAFNVTPGSYVKLINQNFTLGTDSKFNVLNGGTLDFGFDGLNGAGLNALNITGNSGGQTFTATTGSILKITSPDGLTTAAASTTAGNVQVPVGSRTFDPGATYHYIGKASQATGNALPDGLTNRVIVDLQTDATNENLNFTTNGLIKFNSSGILEIRRGKVFDIPFNGFRNNIAVENEDGESDAQKGNLEMKGGRYVVSGSGTKPSLSGAYTLSAGTVEFTGTAAIKIRTSSPAKQYYNVDVSGTNVETSGKDFVVNQVLKVIEPTITTDVAVLTIPYTEDNVTPYVVTAKKGIQVVGARAKAIFKNNANLMQDADAVNNGSVQAERIASMKRGNYTYWSSPVNGQNLKTFSPGTLDTRFYTYDESDDMFDVIDPLTNDFADNGKGYSIRASNNYTGTTNTYVFTGKFEGTPNNGEKTIAVTKTASGNNLIGNPYLSNIDFRDLVTDNPAVFNGGAEAVAYFWTNLNPNPAMQGTGYPGTGYFNNYATLNMSGGVPATLVVDPDDSSQNSNGETPTYYIKPGQGFIIKVAASGDLTFRNNMRKVGDGSVFFNNNKRAEEQTDRFWISLKSPMGAVTTQLIAYLPNATNGFDGQGYDAKIGTLGADAFYSKIENDKFAIQGRGAFAITDQVDLGTSHYEAGIHSIALGKKEGVFANGQHIYLKDKHTNTITDLSAGDYVFNAVAGNTEDRFEIVYENDLVLGTDNQVRKNLIIYRNGDEFIIKSNDDKITEVELYDSVGRLLITVKPNATEARINVSHLSNAFYVLKIDQNGKVSSKKVIK